MAEVVVVVESSITGSLPQVKIKFVLIGGDQHSSRVKTSNRVEEDEDQADWVLVPLGTHLSISRVRPPAREEQLGGTESCIVQNHCVYSIRTASLKEAIRLQRHP